MSLIVSMIVRNESGRYLENALKCAWDAGALAVAVTDDASDDNTVEILEKYGCEIQTTPEPAFWLHEGNARQRHLDFVDLYCRQGDWVLALDGDETINKPERVQEIIERAKYINTSAIGLPLYEFWDETNYRNDGFWRSTSPTVLYAWREGGQINDRPMGCGREPTYVQKYISYNQVMWQNDLHLLHWGYSRKEDRIRKYERYTSREGGHGHSNAHVESIIQEPELKPYLW